MNRGASHRFLPPKERDEGLGGREPKLTLAQYDEIARRHREWRRNAPKLLCAEFGISRTLFNSIVAGYRPKKAR